MTRLTLMTFNAWSGLDYRGILRMGYFDGAGARRARFRALVSAVQRTAPDVLGISEANPLPSYARELAALADLDEVGHMGVSGIRVGPLGIPANLREGDILLARKQLGLRFIARQWLGGFGWVRNSWSFHSGDVTQAVLGSISTASGNVYVAQAHLRHSPPDDDATREKLDRLVRGFGYSSRAHRAALASLRADGLRRGKEVLRLRDFLARAVPAGAPLILMGDFNAEPGWPCLAPLLDAGYRVIAPREGELTWDARGNSIIQQHYLPLAGVRHASLYQHLLAQFDTESRMIDLIFAAPSLTQARVTSSGLCLTRENGVPLSDHYGAMASLEM